MAFNALWPLIAQAQPKDPLLVAVVCSSEGGTHAVDLTGKPAGGAAGSHDHCTLCVAAGDRAAGLPVDQAIAIHRVAGESSAPFILSTTQFQSTASLPAPPRGPPADPLQ